VKLVVLSLSFVLKQKKVTKEKFKTVKNSSKNCASLAPRSKLSRRRDILEAFCSFKQTNVAVPMLGTGARFRWFFLEFFKVVAQLVRYMQDCNSNATRFVLSKDVANGKFSRGEFRFYVMRWNNIGILSSDVAGYFNSKNNIPLQQEGRLRAAEPGCVRSVPSHAQRGGRCVFRQRDCFIRVRRLCDDLF
jgi:hypothetical protein